MFFERFNFKNNKKEIFSGKEVTSKWNGMDPFKRNDVLFRLLSRQKIYAHEVTEFRDKHDFKQLPRHIRSALVELWGER